MDAVICVEKGCKWIVQKAAHSVASDSVVATVVQLAAQLAVERAASMAVRSVA